MADNGKGALYVHHAAALYIQAADTRNIPVVLYSGLEGPTEAWEEDAVGHLPKTVMYDDFVAALKHAGVNHR